MTDDAWLHLEKLMNDMASHVSQTSARQFSLAVTKGRNPDWYRNFLSKPVAKKRPSADVFLGIVHALGRDPSEYIVGSPPPARNLPEVTIIANALTALLTSVGVDPFEGERAYKIALRLPDALLRAESLVQDLATDHPNEQP